MTSPVLNSKGWECPKCGSVYNPSTTQCRLCNDAIEVEHHVPVPGGLADRYKTYNLKYPIRTMEVGESFEVKTEAEARGACSSARGMRRNGTLRGRWLPKQAEDGKWHVWRVA